MDQKYPERVCKGYSSHSGRQHYRHKVRQHKDRLYTVCAAGAFHTSKVSDLIPELSGQVSRFGGLKLVRRRFYKILKEPDNAIIMQYSNFESGQNTLKFTEEAIREMARIAYLENENNERHRARRLHNVMEMLLEEVS